MFEHRYISASPDGISIFRSTLKLPIICPVISGTELDLFMTVLLSLLKKLTLVSDMSGSCTIRY